MATSNVEAIRSVFVTGLKNVHGVENQALSLIDRQLDHLANYPEMAAMLRQHRAETEQQIARVEEILATFDASPSALKDAALSLTGNLAAIAHVFAPDEILKNTFANTAFENFEAASYISLIALADAGGFTGPTQLLKTSLSEEKAMAAWLDENNAMITMKYVQLRAAGETASH